MFDCHFAIELDNRADRAERDAYVDWMRSEVEPFGVERLALITRSPTRGETVAECREDNKLLATLIEEHPDFLHAWAYVHPFQGDPDVQEFRRAVADDGLLGLKWGPLANCADPVADPIAEAAVDMDVPIKVHSVQRSIGTRSDLPEESTSDDTVQLAKRFPDLKILESHIPCPGDWEYRIKKIAPYDNIHLDMSGTNCERGIIEMMVDRVGASRVVYGSDNAHIPCVGKLTGADLSPDEKAEIAYNMNDLLAVNDPRRADPETLASKRAAAAERLADPARAPPESDMIDANAFVGTWPFRELDTDVDGLLGQLDRHNVDRAIVSALEATTYRNVQSTNRRLMDRIEGHTDRLIPFATVNPTYAEWEDDLEECVRDLGMQGVKLLPTYHDYDLSDPAAVEVMETCVTMEVPVLISAVLEDQRGSHPRFDVRGFRSNSHGGMNRDTWTGEQISDLIELLVAADETDVIIADAGGGAYRIVEELDPTVEPGVASGTWTREGETLFVLDDLRLSYRRDGDRIVEEIGPERLVTGPQLPFKYFDSYGVRPDHLPVNADDRRAIRSGTLDRLIG